MTAFPPTRAAWPTTREVPLDPDRSCLLFIDVQNYTSRRDGGEYEGLSDAEFDARYGWFLKEFEGKVLPNMQRLQAACRKAGIEVIYTVIESLTLDGRDRGLDYKITGFNVPKGSWDAKVLDAVAPVGDEIVIPKTSSSVFMSTNIDYVLRAMGIGQVVMVGMLTDQCVESAIRDACDLGYLVTEVTDGCVTQSQARHDTSLNAIKGYCRQMTTDDLIAEIEEISG